MGISFWLTTVAGLIGAVFVYFAGRLDAKAEVAKDVTTRTLWGLTLKGLVAFLAVVVAFCFAAAGNVATSLEQDKKDAEQLKTAKEQAHREEAFKQNSTKTLADIRVKNNALEKLLKTVGSVGSQTKEEVDRSLRELGSTSAKVHQSSRKLQSVAARQEVSIRSLEGLTGGQLQSLRDLWRIQRPFGNWYFQVEFQQKVDTQLSNDLKAWLDKTPDAIINHGGQEDEFEINNRDFSFIDVSRFFVVKPFMQFDLNEYVDTFRRLRTALKFNLDPEYAIVRVRLRKGTHSALSISSTVGGPTKAFGSDGSITNWIHLYGSRCALSLGSLPVGTNVSNFRLYYNDTIAPRECNIRFSTSQRSSEPVGTGGEDLTYRITLSESQLGAFPAEYRRLGKTTKLTDERSPR